MPASTFMPDVTVEVAFATGPDDPSPSWTDISDYVEARENIAITSGRDDELSDIQPSQVTLTLDNKDGRFTPGRTSSPYYPNVRKNRKIRVTAVWPLGGGGTTYRRFTGYVNEWPVEWTEGTSEYAKSQITASSRRARLAGRTELSSIIETELLADSPDAYYPMGEEDPQAGTAGQAGDVSGNQQPALRVTGSGAAIDWAAADGPGTDSLSAPVFAGGKYLRMVANDPLIAITDTSVLLECFFNTSVSPGDMWLTHVMGDPNPTIHLRIATDGTLRGAVGSSPDVQSAGAVDDGLTHHAAIRATISAGTVTMTLYLDGSVADTDTFALAVFPESSIMEVAGLTSFGGSIDQYTGTVSHAAVFSSTTEITSARVLAHANAGLTGFANESTDARIDRLAAWAGIPVGEVSTEAGLTTSIANQDTTGRTPIDLMEEVTATEGGVLFDAGDGTLTFQARTHRYNATSQFTLNAAQDQIEASITAKLDGQQLVNDITATGGSGIVVRVINQSSIDENGIARDTLDLITTSDNEVYDAANWLVQRYAEPDVRLTSVTVDLLNQSSSLVTSLLAAKIGDRITLSNLPSSAPATSIDGFIEGISEVLGAEFYTITFELSPALKFDVWQLDSASYSQLDTTTTLAY